MTKLNPNVHVFDDQTYAVWTAPFGTTAPTTLPPTAPVGFYEVGLLADAGITDAHTYNENKIFDLSGALVRIARNQEERPWTFECLEENAVAFGLAYPGSSVTTTGGTAEVQTVTIGGSPTGGTFTLTLPGIGTTSAITAGTSLPTAATVQTAVQAAFGMAALVTGSAGGPYTVTFPIAEGDVPLMTAASSLTGGTTPSVTVVVATPGVQGVNSRHVKTGTGRNLRAFCIDLVDGTLHKRIVIQNGEAMQTGTVTYSSAGAAIRQFTLQPYKDSNGDYYVILDDDPAQGEAFA